ncbi:MAG: exodeoxyribonuclease VII small subunit [Armatimonadetes bacterium]|nr:exodeoxyribonuclease VII small subunit [Armatimonadota bacterium]NIO75203.1 exodeoxyribonuclease VII small subunit [Armatimonadota bacterium]NIO98601.1 exodeoxyribonuclease VII small subunit [Armatimonadota bacterium]
MARKESPKKSGTSKKELTFEQALDRLEEIVSSLEAGDKGLEEAIALFEEGTKLSNLCQEKLSAAQGKIEKLVEGAGGELSSEELEVAD